MIPPSRRAPEFAMQRAAKALQQQTPGAGRITGASRPSVSGAVFAALRGRTTPAARSAAVTGYVYVTFSYSSPVAADGVDVPASAAVLNGAVGVHGVAISGLNATFDPGIYLITGFGSVSPASNVVASDVSQLHHVLQDSSWVGTDTARLSVDSTTVVESGIGLLQGSVRARCTGGTDRTYNVGNLVHIVIRLDLPA